MIGKSSAAFWGLYSQTPKETRTKRASPTPLIAPSSSTPPVIPPHTHRYNGSIRSRAALPNRVKEIFGEMERRSPHRIVSPGHEEILDCRYRAGVRGETGMVDKTTTHAITITYKWRWGKSPANPSPPNSLFNRELTGNKAGHLRFRNNYNGLSEFGKAEHKINKVIIRFLHRTL